MDGGHDARGIVSPKSSQPGPTTSPLCALPPLVTTRQLQTAPDSSAPAASCQPQLRHQFPFAIDPPPSAATRRHLRVVSCQLPPPDLCPTTLLAPTKPLGRFVGDGSLARVLPSKSAFSYVVKQPRFTRLPQLPHGIQNLCCTEGQTQALRRRRAGGKEKRGGRGGEGRGGEGVDEEDDKDPGSAPQHIPSSLASHRPGHASATKRQQQRQLTRRLMTSA